MSMLDKLLLKGKSDNGDGGCGGDGYGRVGERSGERGFTIVEVMIVIGIGALVAVLVLVAASALQRNARNTSRQNDIGAIQGQLVQYSANRNGNLPATATELKNVLDALELGFYDIHNKDATSPVAIGATSSSLVKNSISYTVFDSGTAPAIGHKRPDADEMHIFTEASCTKEGVTDIAVDITKSYGNATQQAKLLLPASKRVYSILYAQEGENNLFCRDND